MSDIVKSSGRPYLQVRSAQTGQMTKTDLSSGPDREPRAGYHRTGKMTDRLTEADFKTQARRLTSAFSELGLGSLTHSAALEILSRVYAQSSWRKAKQSFKAKRPRQGVFGFLDYLPRIGGRYDAGLECMIHSVHYDAGQRLGFLHIEELNSCDMGGAIEKFEAIDPNVSGIFVVQNGLVDILYVRGRRKWHADHSLSSLTLEQAVVTHLRAHQETEKTRSMAGLH